MFSWWILIRLRECWARISESKCSDVLAHIFVTVFTLNTGTLQLLAVLVLIFSILLPFSLRKHAYSNMLKILPPKTENFQIKNSDIFLISAQNIDCGYSLEPLRIFLISAQNIYYGNTLEPPRRGGSNEYPQSRTHPMGPSHNLCFVQK